MKKLNLLNRSVLALVLTLSSLLGASISGAQENVFQQEAATRLTRLLGGSLIQFRYLGSLNGSAVFAGRSNTGGVGQVGCRLVRDPSVPINSDDHHFNGSDYVVRCYPY